MERNKKLFISFASLHLCVVALILSPSVSAQRIAILTPDKKEASRNFAEQLGSKLGEKLTVLDFSLSEAAYSSSQYATPFNLTTDEVKKIGAAIGCDFFIVLRATTQRRSSFKWAEHYEAYAPVYVVSSRTGRLIFWTLARSEAAEPDDAWKSLVAGIDMVAREVASAVTLATKRELAEGERPAMEEVPEENSPNFKAPIPYRRFKPDYTEQASLYEIAATVDIVVDIGASGIILRTEIVRWAGFGLDESVERAVRHMNWRAAERNGRFIPMRFLLRYNFRKIPKE